jgi:hypothetical protein
MNNKPLSLILILLFSWLIIGCTYLLPGGQKPTAPTRGNETTSSSTNSGQTKPIENSTSSLVEITPDYSKEFTINQNLISFNTGYLFTTPLEKEPAVRTITQNIQPSALRFPGGTLANYYHPDGKGYGFKQEEVKGGFSDITNSMPLFDNNAIYHFADLCKMSNSNVVFVVNMWTGTVEEALWCLDYFHQQNIKVVGVELGNEFYLTQYSSKYSNPQVYIQQAKEFAAVIRKKYPSIPLGIVAGDPTEPNPKGTYQIFMNRWNNELGKESFYDFYIPHLYSKVVVCEQKGGSDLKAVFDCAHLTLAPEFYNYLPVVLDHYKKFYGNKKMWITEWNTDGGYTTANTMLHAEFVSEFLLDLVDLSNKNPEVEYAFFHNYGSTGYASPIFSYSNLNSIAYLKKEGNIAYNSTYFSFLYLREIIDQKAKRVNEKIAYPKGISNQNVIFKTFLSTNKNSIYLYFINKTEQFIQFEIKGAKGITKIEGIQGKYPWSIAGLNRIYKMAPQQVDLIQFIPNNKNANDYTIPANSIGYLEIKL